jgi:hydrogenase nickel incorporation protein HypB
MTKKIRLEKKIEARGRKVSTALRAWFREHDIFVVNLIGSPGSGKTSLLEAAAARLRGRAAVIEGDLETDQDKLRIEKAGLPAYQINTLGACHLDAAQVRRAVESMALDGIRFLFIENVGNLVCPASFEVGEDIKVAVLSTAEGDDKPSKYPVALSVSSAMVMTKMDLLPYIRCDADRMERDARAAKPELPVFRVAATDNGKGVDAFVD